MGGSGRALLDHLLQQVAILKVEVGEQLSWLKVKVTDHEEAKNKEVAYSQSLEVSAGRGGPKQGAQGSPGPGGGPNVPD